MLTDFDKKLLNILQTDLPVARRPFQVLAERLQCQEETVLERLLYLKTHGYLRRVGAFFDSHKLGYVSTLVAVKVEPAYMEAVAIAVNAYAGVTHNYEREGEYNLWFALISSSLQAEEEILAHIRSLPGVQEVLSLPATEKFKVSVQFKL